MSIYMILATLCIVTAASGYIGWVTGINTRRNASYRRGYARGWRQAHDESYERTKLRTSMAGTVGSAVRHD